MVRTVEISNRKKALIISVLVISLCFSMLVGVTLALFTNELSEGTIGIITTAGSIDILIVDEDNESLEGEVLYFEKEEGGEKTILWEPGATHRTEGFSIYNNGTIPVKIQIYVNSGAADSELIDALEISITDDPEAKSSDVKDFCDELDAGSQTGTYYLLIKMSEDAGNKYQGLELNGIGITVHAVQGNVDIGEVDFDQDNGIKPENNNS